MSKGRNWVNWGHLWQLLLSSLLCRAAEHSSDGGGVLLVIGQMVGTRGTHLNSVVSQEPLGRLKEVGKLKRANKKQGDTL